MNILRVTKHRPWPLPDRPWLMEQRWHDLLFMHWPLDASVLQPLIPSGLTLDTYEGKAWIAVVPFRMSGIRLRGMPALPGLSAFPECNVRTYVTCNGKPGVYFFSLDAANPPAVWAARTFFHLPYMLARMSCKEKEDGTVVYESVRKAKGMSAEFRGAYRPVSDVFTAAPGSLDHWLIERYCLYTVWNGRTYRGDIHHKPWRLQRAEANTACNTMLAPLGLPLPPMEPL